MISLHHVHTWFPLSVTLEDQTATERQTQISLASSLCGIVWYMVSNSNHYSLMAHITDLTLFQRLSCFSEFSRTPAGDLGGF